MNKLLLKIIRKDEEKISQIKLRRKINKRNLNAYFCIDDRNKLSFSNLIFTLILKLHEKDTYHLDGSKPVIGCLKIKLFRNHCVSCFKLNLSHCLYLRKVQTKEKNRKIKIS